MQLNARLCDMNVAVSAADERRVEVLASGVACFGGAQLAVDATLRSPLRCDGTPRPGADRIDGIVLAEAARDKRNRYPELATGGRCRLIVVALETGGRFGQEAMAMIRQMASARAQSAPRLLRQAAALAMERRWSRLIACSAARVVAQSLVQEKPAFRVSAAAGPNRREPWLGDVLADARRYLEMHSGAAG